MEDTITHAKRLIDALKSDRHDTEDWPKDSRSALKALNEVIKAAFQQTSKPAHVMVIPQSYGSIDANVLEQVAKDNPEEYFIKGSGVLKLISSIRTLEQKKTIQPTISDDQIDAAFNAAWVNVSKTLRLEKDDLNTDCAEHSALRRSFGRFVLDLKK